MSVVLYHIVALDLVSRIRMFCKCRVLGTPTIELQESFNREASDSVKHPSVYARNFLEYCCFRTLALSIQVTSHLADKKFRRLTYDMMVAWETPGASESLVHVSLPSSTCFTFSIPSFSILPRNVQTAFLGGRF